MSAAHSRVANFLINQSDSLLAKSLLEEHFWDKQVELTLPYFKQRNVQMPAKTLRKMLKICLYTSLNAGLANFVCLPVDKLRLSRGNQLSPNRVVDNLAKNALPLLLEQNIETPEELLG
jgi:hypothetical protein